MHLRNHQKYDPTRKICCISSLDESRLAVAAGASALGLVGPMPSGPGVIHDELIREIAAWAPPSVATFLLTSETAPEAILAHHAPVPDKCAVTGAYEAFRAAISMVKLVQVIHVRDANSVREAVAISREVDALLLDSGSPDLSVKELGGSGPTSWAGFVQWCAYRGEVGRREIEGLFC